MAEKRLTTFKTVQAWCCCCEGVTASKHTLYYCDELTPLIREPKKYTKEMRCNPKNCPVWNKLKIGQLSKLN